MSVGGMKDVFFHKALASIGIGSATVDTRLEKETYHAGEVMQGKS